MSLGLGAERSLSQTTWLCLEKMPLGDRGKGGVLLSCRELKD